MVARGRWWPVGSWRLLLVLGGLAVAGVLAVWWLPYWDGTVRDVLETLSWLAALLTLAGLVLAWALRQRGGPVAEVLESDTTDAPRSAPASSVHNTIAGDARGQAVQARDVSGGIHFHPAPPAPAAADSAAPDEVGLVGRALYLIEDRLPTVSQVG